VTNQRVGFSGARTFVLDGQCVQFASDLLRASQVLTNQGKGFQIRRAYQWWTRKRSEQQWGQVLWQTDMTLKWCKLSSFC